MTMTQTANDRFSGYELARDHLAARERQERASHEGRFPLLCYKTGT